MTTDADVFWLLGIVLSIGIGIGGVLALAVGPSSDAFFLIGLIPFGAALVRVWFLRGPRTSST